MDIRWTICAVATSGWGVRMCVLVPPAVGSFDETAATLANQKKLLALSDLNIQWKTCRPTSTYLKIGPWKGKKG